MKLWNLVKTLCRMTNHQRSIDMSTQYPNLLAYLKEQATMETGRSVGCLDIVAARAKVPESELRDIVAGKIEMSDSIAYALSLVTEPMDDQWEVDDDECDVEAVVELTDDEIRERLQFAADNGKLNMIAHVSGVKGGVETLQGILAVGEGSIDPVTRMMLITVME